MAPLSLTLLTHLLARRQYPSYHAPTPPDAITYGPDATCTLATCSVKDSIYQYRPSLASNLIFLLIFAAIIFFQAFQGYFWSKHGRKTWGFMTCMILGCVSEIVGYAGRLIMWNNPFSFIGFMLQICCITLAPVFFTAAIYFTISQLVLYLGVQYSRLSPKFFYWIFIPCDIISLILQGTGGGLSSSSEGTSDAAVDIAVAGLIFQVITLTVFCLLVADYTWRYQKGTTTTRSKASTGAASASSPHGAAPPRPSLPTSFKMFATALALATIFILIRCGYRIDELSQGYRGSEKITDQGLFIALEGVMVVLAAILLCVAHPGYGFRDLDVSGSEGRREREERGNEKIGGVGGADSDVESGVVGK